MICLNKKSDGKNANPATVTIYSVNGKDDIQTYRGMTTPQSDSYSTLNAGDYKLYYQDMATSVYGEKGALAHNPPIASALTYRITKLDGNEILNGTKNGLKHQQTIRTNDPNSKVILKTVE